MNITVDTSAIIAVLGDEPEKPEILRQTAGHDLFAAQSLPLEIGNACSAMLKRQRTTLAEAIASIRLYQQMQMTITLVNTDLERAMDIAAQLSIYAYDAYVIDCALSLNCPLITLDKGLIYAATTAGVTLIEVKS
jgi:predicted nucleic acid-binding protein